MCAVSRRCVDIDPVTGAMRVYHQLLQIIPPGWVEATAVLAGKWREAHSGDAHLIPLIKELRLLAPAGTIKMEANRDCEYGVFSVKVCPVERPGGSCDHSHDM